MNFVSFETVEQKVDNGEWIPLTDCEFVKNNNLTSLFVYHDITKDAHVVYNSEKDVVHELPKEFI